MNWLRRTVVTVRPWFQEYGLRTLCSAVLLGAAFLLFALPGNPGIEELIKWVGLLLLALAVWSWRGPLRLTGIGMLSGLPYEQQDPAESDNDEELALTIAPDEGGEGNNALAADHEPVVIAGETWLDRASEIEFRDLRNATIEYLK